MEPQNIQPQSPQNLAPPISEPRRMNKPLLFIVFILIAVAIGFGYFIFKDTPRPQITGLEVASSTSLFLDKTLEADGGMAGGFSCPASADKCHKYGVSQDQPHLGQAIYAYYLLAQATGDESYRTKADRAMNFVLDKCQTNVEMCTWNFFPLARYYLDTKEEKYLRGMLVPSEQFLAMSDKNVIAQNVGHKLASLYQATGDERYKTRLLAVADAIPFEEQDIYPISFVQEVWSVYLPAYAITNDEKYLNASERYFDHFYWQENITGFPFTDLINKSIDSLLTLSEISSRGAIYKGYAHDLLQKTMDEYWDTPENLIESGDYGFFDVQDDPRAKFKKTLSNGWLMKSYIRIGDEKFNLPTKND